MVPATSALTCRRLCSARAYASNTSFGMCCPTGISATRTSHAPKKLRPGSIVRCAMVKEQARGATGPWTREFSRAFSKALLQAVVNKHREQKEERGRWGGQV